METRTVLSVVVVVAALLICNTAAETYIVGDSVGWRVLPGGAAVYTAWAAQHNFVVGDVLEFRFSTGVHTAARVTKEAFDSCNVNNPPTLQTNGPANYTLGAAGPYYFICTIGNHCSLGQKLTVNAAAGSPGAGSSPTTPSGGITPTSSPPPPSFASRTAFQTPSLILISVVIACLRFL